MTWISVSQSTSINANAYVTKTVTPALYLGHCKIAIGSSASAFGTAHPYTNQETIVVANTGTSKHNMLYATAIYLGEIVHVEQT